jgi:ribonuclease PH/non-canonical purine NTP pyrophosphatase (RdgB/HAM1 family)
MPATEPETPTPEAGAAPPARSNSRAAGELRPVAIEPGFVRTATGSALISAGGTRVICTASAVEDVPRWMKGQGRGWVTAEYSMLPASTGERKQRDVARGRPDGRTVEIQRLIGRSIRGVVDFGALGERTIYLDCDVLEADGGTRCASITGAYVALHLALSRLVADGRLPSVPLTQSVAAVSCGIVRGVPLLDLDYAEDSTAEVDANVVMTGDGGLVEVQATAERTPLSRASLDELLALAAPRGPARGHGRARPRLRTAAVRLVVASRNEHKLRELGAMLRAHELVPLPPDVELPPETGATFADNARTKALVAAGATGLPAIADDSGIEAAALDGRPGVRSARFAGEHATDAENLAKLLRDVPEDGDRRVRYVCVLAFAQPGAADGDRPAAERLFEGSCTGMLAAAPRGAGGFGYDPAFVPDDLPGERTMAELDPAEKDAISHRGRAARAFAEWLDTVTVMR